MDAALDPATALELRPLRAGAGTGHFKKSHRPLPTATGPMRRCRCLAAGRDHYQPWLTPPCGGSARHWPCRPAALMLGSLRSSGQGGPEHAGPGNGVDQGFWLPQTLRRPPSAASGPAPSRAPGAPSAPCVRPCVRPCVAPRTGCSTSPDPPRPSGSGSRTARSDRSPPRAGGTWAYSCAFPVLRLSGRGPQAGTGRACGGHEARRIGHNGLATGFPGPPAHPGVERAR